AGAGLLEVVDALAERVGRALVPVVASLEVQPVRLGVLGLAPREARLLLAGEPQPQRGRDLARDVLRHAQHVGRPARTALSPGTLGPSPAHAPQIPRPARGRP